MNREIGRLERSAAEFSRLAQQYMRSKAPNAETNAYVAAQLAARDAREAESLRAGQAR